MTPTLGRTGLLARVALWLLLTGLVFVLLQSPARHAETWTVAEMVRALHFHGITAVSGTSLLLQPTRRSGFWVVVTPSCSSLGPALALALIAIVLSRGRPSRNRFFAATAGVAAIVAGNLIRIGASVVVGLLAGRVSLVLFHDWVGSLFGFAYTLGGFIVMLSLLLPAARRPGSAVV